MTAVTSRRPPDRQLFRHFRRLTMASAICGAFVLLAAGKIGAGPVWLVSFTIDGSYAGGVNVVSDTGLSYTDYRIPADPHPSPCVQVDQSPTGGVFAVFNRKIDDIGTRCNPSGSDRQFRISIDAPSACLRVFNAYSASAVDMHFDGTCELFYNDDPRVRMERVFSNQTHTAVAFLTRMSTSSVSYEIRTDTDATVAVLGANQRLVTYFGKAHLWEFGGASKTGPVADAFNLKHQMTFTRDAQ